MVSALSFQLAVFDMDGTLLDTIEDLTVAVNHALQLYGLPQRTTAEVRSFVGNGIRHTLRLAAPNDSGQPLLDRLYSDFTAYYEVHNADHTTAYPGLTGLLIQLRQANILTAVVSNKQDAAVKSLAERFYPGLFDLAIGQRDGIRRKPAPDSIDLVLEHLNILPDAAVYIGDSEVDLLTAANAALPCISVSWGYRSAEMLRGFGAKLIIDSADALLAAILNRESVA